MEGWCVAGKASRKASPSLHRWGWPGAFALSQACRVVNRLPYSRAGSVLPLTKPPQVMTAERTDSIRGTLSVGLLSDALPVSSPDSLFYAVFVAEPESGEHRPAAQERAVFSGPCIHPWRATTPTSKPVARLKSLEPLIERGLRVHKWPRPHEAPNVAP